MVSKIKSFIQTDLSSSFTTTTSPFAGYFSNTLKLKLSFSAPFLAFYSGSASWSPSTPFPVYSSAPIPGSFSVIFQLIFERRTFTSSGTIVKFLMMLMDTEQRERERKRQGDARLMLQALGSGRVSLCKEQLPSGVI